MELLEPLKSQEFTDEQKQYLLGFFSAAAERAKPFVGHTAAGLITADPTLARSTKRTKRKRRTSAPRFPIFVERKSGSMRKIRSISGTN